MNSFDQIIGYAEEKKELERIADALKNREAYERLGVSAPKGLLLAGDPGLGKTLMATALIEASGRKAFVCRKDQPNGEFIRTIKATFEEAAGNAPSIVFLDDMDKFANGDENRKNAEEYVTVQSCIDECRGKDVFVLATVNNIRTLPRSLQRAGRFDRIMRIQPPRGSDAVKIVSHYLQGKSFVGDMDAEVIASLMSGKSCAELETVINEAGMYAGFHRSQEITMEHFMTACLKTVYNVSGISDPEDDDDWDDDDRFCLHTATGGNHSPAACHEAGHAVISEVLCPGSVTLICTRKNSRGIGGFTQCMGIGNETPSQLMRRRILGALGGRAAEELVFGAPDLGCDEDITAAFNTVQTMIGDHCTSGFQYYKYGRDSQELVSRREQIVAAEVEKYYHQALSILRENREFLDKIAAALDETGLLTLLDIRTIRKECACLKNAG